MKKLLLFLIILTMSLGVFSQTITFDGESWDESWRVSIDTVNPLNIWQIGSPHKVFFDSARSFPRAIVTDTSLNYTSVNSSSFYILTNNHAPGAMPVITFSYKIDSDSLLDFGSIEASTDNGQTWKNFIANPTTFITFDWFIAKETNDSIVFEDESNNLPFTGRSEGWYACHMELSNFDEFFQYNDTIIYKFTFQSTSGLNTKEGWMLDNIEINDLMIGIDKIQGSVCFSAAFPNPTNKRINFNFPPEPSGIVELRILNASGSIVKTAQLNYFENSIDISELPPSFYYYQLLFKCQHFYGKFIKF